MTAEFDEQTTDSEQEAVADVPEVDETASPAETEVAADSPDVEGTATDTEEADADDADGAEETPDPLQEFRDRLWSQPGDWYVIHTYAGMENRVRQNLENRTISMNVEDEVHEVVVPMEEVTEIKNGQRKLVKRTVLPGYVLVRMEMNDRTWTVVRHTPSVTGFVGNAHEPFPLSLTEVERMLAPAVEAQVVAEATPEASDKPQQAKATKVEFSDFSVGDSVMVVGGPFATMHATVTEINVDTQRVKALVEIFGRETPVELGLDEIEKE